MSQIIYQHFSQQEIPYWLKNMPIMLTLNLCAMREMATGICLTVLALKAIREAGFSHKKLNSMVQTSGFLLERVAGHTVSMRMLQVTALNWNMENILTFWEELL